MHPPIHYNFTMSLVDIRSRTTPMMSGVPVGKIQIKVPFSLGSWYLFSVQYYWKIDMEDFSVGLLPVLQRGSAESGFAWWFVAAMLSVADWQFGAIMVEVEIVNLTQPTTSSGSCTPCYCCFLSFQHCRPTSALSVYRHDHPTTALLMLPRCLSTATTSSPLLFSLFIYIFFQFPLHLVLSPSLTSFFLFPLKNILWIS